jgi:integrase
MPRKRSRGRPPKYVVGKDGKPIVGLSCDANGFYNTHWRTDGIKRVHFATPDDYDTAVHNFRKWESRRKKETITIAITDENQKQEFLLQQYRRLQLNKDGIAELKAAAAGVEYCPPDVDATISEDLVWAKARELILNNPPAAVAEKLGIPELANLHTLRPLPKPLTLRQIGDIYFNRKIRPLNRRERDDSERWWRQFCKMVDVKNIREVTLEHIQRYQNRLYNIYNKKGHKPTWIKHRYDKIKTILNYAKKSKDVEHVDDINRVLDYCKKFVYPDKAKVNPCPIEKDDYLNILALANSKERAILLLAANAALYPQDCCDIKKTHIDLIKRTLVMDRGKTGVPRVAVLWFRTVKAIRSYLKEEKRNHSDYLFLTYAGKPYSAHSIGSIWRKLRKKAKVDHAVKFEHIRDASQTAAIDAECTIDEVRFLMGHRVQGITDNYLKRKPNLTKKACVAIEKYFFGK